MRNQLNMSARHHLWQGATLMEVLITMVIMLFGLIGLSQMFIKAQRTASEAYDRHHALSLANYMAEMMRSMIRLQDTPGSTAVQNDVCPDAGSVPSNGLLTNEQTMACFVELSRPGGAGQPVLGKFLNDATVTAPTVLKSSLTGCSSPTGSCNVRQMVLYMLNTWTESLANYSQTNTAPGIYSSRTFNARGCIDKICDAEGNIGGACGANRINGTYRVRVYWRADEAVPHDANRYYCGVTPDDFMRYTFVDVTLPVPPSTPSN